MPDGPRLQVRAPMLVSNYARIASPKLNCGLDKSGAIAGQMIRLSDKMRHRETDIEGRIAEMDYFVVEQYQPADVYQHVFRTVITMNNA